MNTNLGDIPLDIFSDYISEQLDIEFDWSYLFPNTEFTPFSIETRTEQGCGPNTHMHDEEEYLGCGIIYHRPEYASAYGDGFLQNMGSGFFGIGKDGIANGVCYSYEDEPLFLHGFGSW